MITADAFINMALSFAGTGQKPHFDRTGFHVIGKRMFATYLPGKNTANIFLTTAEQRLFCEINPESIYPVPNKWGEKGATTFELDTVPKEILLEALISAYTAVVKSKK
jgi:hypothetical protein